MNFYFALTEHTLHVNHCRKHVFMIDDAPVSSSLLVKEAVWSVIHGRGNTWQICTCRYSLVVCNEHTEHRAQRGGGGGLSEAGGGGGVGGTGGGGGAGGGGGGGGFLNPGWRGALFSRTAAGGGPLLALALSTTSNWLALTRQL